MPIHTIIELKHLCAHLKTKLDSLNFNEQIYITNKIPNGATNSRFGGTQ